MIRGGFHLFPRGSYYMEGYPNEVADYIADYVTNPNVTGHKRKLDLTDPGTKKAINILKDSEKTEIDMAYVIEGKFTREPTQEAAERLGFSSNLMAIVLGSPKDPTKAEVLPFLLKVREEDLDTGDLD